MFPAQCDQRYGAGEYVYVLLEADTRSWTRLILGALILGSRRSSRVPGKRDGGKLCRSGPPAAEQMARHAAALRGISRGPLDAFFSSGLSHNSILKLVFAAADG